MNYLINGDYNFAELNNEHNAKGEMIITLEKARKNPEGLGFNPGSTHNLDKHTRIPGHTSSSDFL